MSKCPCGSTKELSDCCGPYIEGTEWALTPEALMRSRYSAYVLKNIDYIVKTHHPASNENLDLEAIKSWSDNAKWHGLNIIDREESDLVEFVADFEIDGERESHHELSSFKKHEGNWHFFEGKVVGEPIERATPKVGRNDPCHCGSGKKYKKCCL